LPNLFFSETGENMETDFLIVGAGFAGLETAIQLRRKAAHASITLLTREPHLVYKSWLVYLPAQHKRFDQCLVPLEPQAAQHRLWFLVETATSLSPEEHQAQLAGGERIHPACMKSTHAYQVLEHHGYRLLRHDQGGLLEWEAAGSPVEGEGV
jgi:NADH dehydrogenase FAD-containing subunit